MGNFLNIFFITGEAMPKSEQHPIVRYRRRHSLSLLDFAALVNTTKTTISRIENGRRDPGIGLLRQIMAATRGEVSADAILNFRHDEKSESV